MMVYRFTQKAYSHDISGEGARLHGGRWNTKGIPVVYTSSTISLALIELLIHSARYEEMTSNVLMQIQVPDTSIASLKNNSLKPNWQADIDYCQNIGDSFLTSGKSLMMKVPSAIIEEEFNVLINPEHSAIKKVTIYSARKFHFDTRMFKINN